MRRPSLFLFFLCLSIHMIPAQEWATEQKITPEPYLNSAWNEFGSSLDISGDYAVVGTPGYRLNAGCAYVLHFDGEEWTKVAVLKPSDSIPGQKFGASVRIDGDAIAIGAPEDTVSGARSGSAYIFERPASGWSSMTENAKLVPSNGIPYALFGSAVGIYGTTVIVGSPQSRDYGVGSGLAYIFQKPETGWTDMTETAILHASNASFSDGFGTSVDIGPDHAVVGAPRAGDDEKFYGTAYVYTMPEEGWTDATETARLMPSDTAEYDDFGMAVAISGNTIVVGSPYKDGPAENAGAGYIFLMPEGGWKDTVENAKLTASDPRAQDLFGISVDVYDTCIVIGAEAAGPYGEKNGAAYVFEKPAEGWSEMTETARLYAGQGEDDDLLGKDVGIYQGNILAGAIHDNDLGTEAGSACWYKRLGEGWADGPEDQLILPDTYLHNADERMGGSLDMFGEYAVIGATGYNGDRGCAYVLKHDGEQWITLGRLTASDAQPGSAFGIAAGIYENTIVIGAHYQYQTGMAYVFEKPEGEWTDMTETAVLQASTPEQADYFGTSVDIYEDVIVVGAMYDDVTSSTGGAVYVYRRPPSGWADTSETAILTASDVESMKYLGNSVAIFDKVIVAGAKGANVVHSNDGSAYVFVEPEGGWIDMTQTAKLSAEDGFTDEYFGYAVDIDSSTIAVGTPANPYLLSQSGAVYVFTEPPGGWTDATEDSRLKAINVGSGDHFGSSVSIKGNQMLIGAKDFNPDMPGQGAAYIYTKTGSGWSIYVDKKMILAPDSEGGDYFGHAGKIDGDRVLITAFGDDDQGFSSGAAYAYTQFYPVDISDHPSAALDICPGQVVEFQTGAENARAYIWQVSTDNGNSFLGLTEEYPYSGTLSPILQVTADTSLDHAYYRCMAYNLVYSDTSISAMLSIETEDPVITSTHPDQTLIAETGNQVSLPDFTDDLTATDNCPGDLTVIQDPAPGTLVGTEGTIVTLTVIDAAGNEDQSYFMVSVEPDAIPNADAIKFHIYPNPVSHELMIESTDMMAGVTLLDMHGRTVMEERVAGNRIKLSFAGLSRGMYFLRVITADKAFCFRIAKE